MPKFRIFFLSLLLSTSLLAQIEFNGTADFELSYGGDDSNFLINEIANDYNKPHLGIHQFNLFMFAAIDESFFFNGRIQWDTWGSGKLNAPRLALASLSWEPEDMPVSLTVGRFVNPFGLYPKRQLASDNLFVNGPLAYTYFINISDTRGLWPTARENGLYGANDVGSTTIYFGGYTTGMMANWIVVDEFMDISIAASNAAISSARNYTNLQNMAFTTRLGLQPVIYWQQGFSFSYGSFLQKESVNEALDRLEKYRQMLIATDFVLAYGYFELSGEFIFSNWQVPGWNSNGYQMNDAGKLIDFDVQNYSAYADLKFEPSFLTGSYLALRFETMQFTPFKAPNGSSLIVNKKWDDNLIRYSAAVGYKLSRSVQVKFAFSEQIYEDKSIKLEDYTFRTLLSVSM